MTTEELRSGSTLAGRYRIKSRGTSRELGTAYVAWDAVDARVVHLLVLAPHYGTSQEVMRKLAGAQHNISALKLPALPPFALVGAQRRREAEGHLFLTRALQEGETLASRLLREGHLEVEAAIEIAISLCQVLTAAHRARLVHGGLTPDHVLIQDDGGVVVTGAGIWPALHPGIPPCAPPVTPSPWRSPEQAAGQVTLPSSDVFTVGALLYYALCGQPPFGQAHASRPAGQGPPGLQGCEPRVPDWLAQVVQKTLAWEPSQRYRNAGQLLQILRSGARAGLEPTPSKPAPLSQGRPAYKLMPHGTALPTVAKPQFEPRTTGDDTDVPDAWTYVPGTDLPVVYDPAIRYRRRRRDRWDAILLALLIALVLAVLGLIAVWWAVHQRWSASLEPAQTLPYYVHGDALPADSLSAQEQARIPHVQTVLLQGSLPNTGKDRMPFGHSIALPHTASTTLPASACNWNPRRVSAIMDRSATASGLGNSLELAALGVELTARRPSRSRMQPGWQYWIGPRCRT